MWIKSTRGELINADQLCSISYVDESSHDRGTYGNTDNEVYFISDNDCTTTIIEAIMRGTAFLEVR